jgi:predicted MFS family arabinose efflux permease
VQSFAPLITGKRSGLTPDGKSVFWWAAVLLFIPAGIALALNTDFFPAQSLIIGLLLFGLVFAVNSSLHSYLIVSYASHDGVSLDVGFYYMANAMGRLLGTVLSGYVFQVAGLEMCLWISALFIALSAWLALGLPKSVAA